MQNGDTNNTIVNNNGSSD